MTHKHMTCSIAIKVFTAVTANESARGTGGLWSVEKQKCATLTTMVATRPDLTETVPSWSDFLTIVSTEGLFVLIS